MGNYGFVHMTSIRINLQKVLDTGYLSVTNKLNRADLKFSDVPIFNLLVRRIIGPAHIEAFH